MSTYVSGARDTINALFLPSIFIRNRGTLVTGNDNFNSYFPDRAQETECGAFAWNHPSKTNSHRCMTRALVRSGRDNPAVATGQTFAPIPTAARPD